MKVNFNTAYTQVPNISVLQRLIDEDRQVSVVLTGNITGTGALVIPATINIKDFINGAMFTGYDSVTIGKMSYDGLNQISTIPGSFSISATPLIFSVDAVKHVHPEWFGDNKGNLIYAINSLPSIGGKIQLVNHDYNICGIWTVSQTPGAKLGNQKANVKIYGSGMPVKSSDGTRFVSGSGTVIQGRTQNFANGFEAYDLGVDCGDYVVDTLNDGGYMDGFVAGSHKLDHDGLDLEYYIKDVHFGNIKVLMKIPLESDSSTWFHGLLIEHIIGVSHGYCEIDGGYHGYVVKAINVKGGNVWAYGQQFGTGYIIKSDQYVICRNVTIDSITLGRNDTDTVAAGGFMESATGYVTANVNIGRLVGNKCKTLLQWSGDGAIADFNIGTIMADAITGSGIIVGANNIRFNIGLHIINQASVSGIITLAGCMDVNIGNGVITNAGSHGYDLGGDVRYGAIDAVGCTGHGINRGSGVNIDFNLVRGRENGLSLVSSSLLLLDYNDFLNNWANEENNTYPFQVTYCGNTLYFRGTIKNGTAATIATLPLGYRMDYIQSFCTYAIKADTTRTFAQIDVLVDGSIQVANLTDLGASCRVALNFSYQL